MSETWTVLRILEWTRGFLEAKGSLTPRLDAELLLCRVLGLKERIALYTSYDRPLNDSEREGYRELVRRRSTGEPTQYILEEQEFWSIAFRVEPGVLIPRPETELLVEEALTAARALIEAGHSSLRIADVGTGTGCVAIALASELPEARFVATDIEPVPLRLARLNAQNAGVSDRVDVVVADGLEGVSLADGPFHLVISNPPYISDGEFDGLMRTVRDFEPRTALTAGEEGLDVIAPLIARASEPEVLLPGGTLGLEISDRAQSEKVSALLEAAGFCDVQIREDYSGVPRVVVAKASIG
jgi:release factor glutamine methyltransferase